MRSYIKTRDYSKVTVEYHHLQEHRRGGDQLALPPHEALIAEQLKHSINTGGVKFDLFSPDEKQRLGIYARHSTSTATVTTAEARTCRKN